MPDFRDRIAVIRHDSETTTKFYYDRATGAESAYELGRDPLELNDILRELPTPRLEELRQRAKTALLGH